MNQNLALESIPAKHALRKPTFAILAAEFGGGLLGGVSGTILGGLVGFGLAYLSGSNVVDINYDKGFIIWMIAGGYIFGTLGSAGGTYIVGTALHQNGRFLPTLAGSASGLLVLSPFGSIIGYSLSRPKTQEQGFLFNHIDLPSFSFRTERTKENKIIQVYDFRLVNARF